MSGVGGIATLESSGGASGEHLFVSGDCASWFVGVSIISVWFYLPSTLLKWMGGSLCPHSLSTHTVLSPAQYE